MNVRSLFLLLAAVTALLAPVAAADAATTSYPSISRIQPLHLAIGETMTISGKNFLPGKNRNTVVFKRTNQRAIFAKASTATTRKITVVVPEKLRVFLNKNGLDAIPTKFRIRVLARRFGKRYTKIDASPTIAPVGRVLDGGSGGGGDAAPPAPTVLDCDRDGQVDDVDVDDDNDGINDLSEQSYRTNPCAADTDGDGMWDFYEIEAALDLNTRNYLPYPGKRPHPNALDGTDANMDWDGDGLLTHQEHALWQAGGRPSLLNYSDGDQSTGPAVDAPGAPNEQLDIDGDGELTDDEKDFDGDRLPNWVEANGPLQPNWWETVKPYKDETPYFNEYDGTDYLDWDTDGDELPDGEDDQDFDSYDNITEMFRGPLYIHPFNPCMPDPDSRSCSRYIPADLDKPYPPFDGSYSFTWDDDDDALTPEVPVPFPLPFPHPDLVP